MRSLAIVAMIFVLSGCGVSLITHEITGQELYEKDRTSMHGSFINSYYYKGSDSKYHYFHVAEMMDENNYRIPLNDLNIERPTPYTSDKIKWQKMRIWSDVDDKVVAVPESEINHAYMVYPTTVPSTQPYVTAR